MDAMAAGSLGIAAVVATAGGEIVSSARNQISDDLETGNALRNLSIAHAEINAIAAIPTRYRTDKSLVLYAAVEPCPLCMGAIVMSQIRNLHVACRDPYAGALGMLERDPFMAGRKVRVTREGGPVEELFFYTHLLGLLRRIPGEHPFFEAMRREYPNYCARLAALDGDPRVWAAIRARSPDNLLDLVLERAGSARV